MKYRLRQKMNHFKENNMMLLVSALPVKLQCCLVGFESGFFVKRRKLNWKRRRSFENGEKRRIANMHCMQQQIVSHLYVLLKLITCFLAPKRVNFQVYFVYKGCCFIIFFFSSRKTNVHIVYTKDDAICFVESICIWSMELQKARKLSSKKVTKLVLAKRIGLLFCTFFLNAAPNLILMLTKMKSSCSRAELDFSFFFQFVSLHQSDQELVIEEFRFLRI